MCNPDVSSVALRADNLQDHSSDHDSVFGNAYVMMPASAGLLWPMLLNMRASIMISNPLGERSRHLHSPPLTSASECSCDWGEGIAHGKSL